MKYRVMLNGELIGTTNFEFADPPMGIVYGKLNENNIQIDYQFLKQLSNSSIAELVFDHSEDKLISVMGIKGFTVLNDNGDIINEDMNQIEGMDSDYYTLTIRLSYPKYEIEFPHHVETYNNAFD